MKSASIFKKFTFLFFLYSIQVLTAQNRWKEITIYTATGDSVKGEISLGTNFKSFYGISVRDNSSGATKEYKPSEVKSFVISTPQQKLYFKTFQVEADFSPNDIPNLQVSPLVNLEKDIVFAQLLVNGAKELYQYKDNRAFKMHYLIKMDENKALDLINKRYYINSSKSASAFSEEYKKQLTALLLNSSSVNASRINKTGFRESELKSLIKEYNTSVNEPGNYEFKNEAIDVCFGIVGGFNFTTLEFSGADSEWNALKFNSSVGANAGIKLDLVIPRTQKKWSIYNEALLSNYNLNSNEYYFTYKTDIEYEKRQIKLSATYLKISNAARFKSTGSLAFLIQAGIVNSFAFKHSCYIIKEQRLSSKIDMSKEKFPFRMYEQSLFAGIGCEFKKVGLEFRYERGNGMAVDPMIASKMRYAYVLLSYAF